MLNASPSVMERAASESELTSPPLMTASHVVTGKKTTALMMSTIIGNSMSAGFAALFAAVSSAPDAGPYSASLYSVPRAASSSDRFMGPKSRLRKITANTSSSASSAYRL